jgi:hypothetical protein
MLNTMFEHNLSLQAKQPNEDMWLARLENRIMEVAGHLETILNHSSE